MIPNTLSNNLQSANHVDSHTNYQTSIPSHKQAVTRHMHNLSNIQTGIYPSYLLHRQTTHHTLLQQDSHSFKPQDTQSSKQSYCLSCSLSGSHPCKRSTIHSFIHAFTKPVIHSDNQAFNQNCKQSKPSNIHTTILVCTQANTHPNILPVFQTPMQTSILSIYQGS